jgi:uncharacterized protein YtpQ (UPF0354 family)
MCSWHWCGRTAAALLLVLFSRSLFADTVTDRVRAAIATAAPDSHTEVRPDGGIHVTRAGGEWTMYTDNVQKQCDEHPTQCDAAITQFVAALLSVGDGSAFALTEANVLPVVRSGALLKNLTDLVHQEPGKTPVSESFTSDSVVLYAIDSPKAIRFAVATDLQRQGLSGERLQTVAMANVKRLAPVKISPLANSNGLVAAITQDTYATSRLFDPDFVRELEQAEGGPVVVAIPTRDWILAANAADAAAVARLRKVAGQIFRGEAYAVTPQLVRWDGHAWQEVPQPGR